MLTIFDSTTNAPILSSVGVRNEEYNYDWLNYFNPEAALRSVIAYVGTLPSSKTEEKHTYHSYMNGLHYLFGVLSGHDPENLTHDIWYYVNQPMPLLTESIMTKYLAHLLTIKGVSAKTASNKYQVAARHWLRYLVKQSITGLSLEQRLDVYDYKQSMRDAIEVPNPQPTETTNVSPLQQHGTRLNVLQVNALVEQQEEDESLTGMRDLALICTGLTSALRVSELRRITLAKIKSEGGHYLITVRGKRNQVDAVTIDQKTYLLIMRYVEKWNSYLTEDDPRYIHDNTPLWQATRAGRPEGIGVNRYNPARGISRNALSDIVNRRTKQHINTRIAPHDLRRTYAFLMALDGQPTRKISRQLRHKSEVTTEKYIGELIDMSDLVLANHIKINVTCV